MVNVGYQENLLRWLILLFVPLVIAVFIALGLDLLYLLIFALTFLALLGIKRSPISILTIALSASPIIWCFADVNLISLFGFQINLPMVVGGVIFSLIFFLFGNDAISGKVQKLRFIILIYAIFTIPSIFFSSYISTGIGVFIRIFCPLIMMFTVGYFASEVNNVYMLSDSMKNAVYFVPIILIFGYLKGDLIRNFTGFSRLNGTGIPFQTFSFYLVVLIGILLLNFELKKRKHFQIYLITIILLSVLVFFTYLRTAWFSLLLLLFGYSILFKNKKMLLLLVILCILIVLLYPNLIESLLFRYVDNVSSYENINSVLSGRLNINKANLDYHFKVSAFHFFFGNGLGNSILITQEMIGTRAYVHNDFLAILVESGLFSLVAYVWFLISLLAIIINAIKKPTTRERSIISRFSAIFMLIIFITGMFGNLYSNVISTLPIYSVFGMLLARINKDHAII